MGSVSLFMTDAPSDEFEAVNITLEKIQLLDGPRGHTTIFEGRETFDLMALRDASEILSFTGQVPAGRYGKIRLALAEQGLEIVKADGSSEYPALADGNRIELHPAEKIEVSGGQLLAMEMDIDVDRSFEANRHDPKRHDFKPAISTRVIRDAADGKIARLRGTIDNLNEDSQTFELCQLKRPHAWLKDKGHHGYPARPDAKPTGRPGGKPMPRPGDKPMPRPDGAPMLRPNLDAVAQEDAEARHDPRTRCTAVSFAAGAALFDSNADPVALLTADQVGTHASVAGRLQPLGDAMTLTAFVMLLGTADDFDHRVGQVASEFDPAEQTFALDLAFGDGEVIVQLSDATKLFEKGGVELGSDAISLGTRVKATGILLESEVEGEPATFKAAILSLHMEEPDREPLHGEIVAIRLEPDRDLGECPLEISLESGEFQGVTRVRHTAIFLNNVSTMQSAEIGLSDLTLGEKVTIFGVPAPEDAPADARCYRARVIMAYGQPSEQGSQP